MFMFPCAQVLLMKNNYVMLGGMEFMNGILSTLFEMMNTIMDKFCCKMDNNVMHLNAPPFGQF